MFLCVPVLFTDALRCFPEGAERPYGSKHPLQLSAFSVQIGMHIAPQRDVGIRMAEQFAQSFNVAASL